jgi:hypothetical protein
MEFLGCFFVMAVMFCLSTAKHQQGLMVFKTNILFYNGINMLDDYR